MNKNHNNFNLHTFKKVWICESCGCEFVTKFQDYNLCSTCLKGATDKIHEKMMKNPDYKKHFK